MQESLIALAAYFGTGIFSFIVLMCLHMFREEVDLKDLASSWGLNVCIGTLFILPAFIVGDATVVVGIMLLMALVKDRALADYGRESYMFTSKALRLLTVAYNVYILSALDLTPLMFIAWLLTICMIVNLFSQLFTQRGELLLLKNYWTTRYLVCTKGYENQYLTLIRYYQRRQAALKA